MDESIRLLPQGQQQQNADNIIMFRKRKLLLEYQSIIDRKWVCFTGFTAFGNLLQQKLYS